MAFGFPWRGGWRFFCVALALGGAVATGRADSSPGVLPPGTVWIGSYADAIAQMGRLLNRKTVPSPELSEWMTDHNLNGGGGFAWPLRKTTSLRELLDDFCLSTGLGAFSKEDSDSVQVDFGWHRPSQAKGADLLAFLLHQPPPDKPAYFPVNIWEQHFDALLSTPQNFPRVWKLRQMESQRHWAFGNPSATLYAGRFIDDAGRVHVLILRGQEAMTNPGVSSASYYLFDTQGRFERGGNFDTGHRIHFLSAYVNPERTELTLEGWFNFNQAEYYQFYRLGAHGLLLRAAEDGDGKILQNVDGLGFGRMLYATPEGRQP